MELLKQIDNINERIEDLDRDILIYLAFSFITTPII